MSWDDVTRFQNRAQMEYARAAASRQAEEVAKCVQLAEQYEKVAEAYARLLGGPGSSPFSHLQRATARG